MLNRLAISAALVIMLRSLPAIAAPTDCEPARCAVQTALDSQCPCDQAKNHGQHVSCVSRVLNGFKHDGTIPPNCKGRIQRCAARSICGKSGFVTCQIPTDTCDLTTGFCTGDPSLACLTDLDCGSVCRIKSSSDLCTARGGVPGSGSTCCADCAPTP